MLTVTLSWLASPLTAVIMSSGNLTGTMLLIIGRLRRTAGPAGIECTGSAQKSSTTAGLAVADRPANAARRIGRGAGFGSVEFEAYHEYESDGVRLSAAAP